MIYHVILYIIVSFAAIVTGIIWGYFRWKQYQNQELEFYSSEKTRFLQLHRIQGDLPEFLKYEWRDFVKKDPRLNSIPPQSNDFKAEIVFDVVLWPISLSIVVIQLIFKVIFHAILTEYNKTTNQKISSLEKDLKG